MPALRRPRKKPVLVTLAVLLVLFLAWLTAAYQVFYNVHTVPPKHADAVVMLGGASKERLLDAMLIRDEIKAKYLVLSYTNTAGNASADDYCSRHSNKAIYPDVICFTPNPLDTRGEAEQIGKLVSEQQWNDVVVVTSKYHIERSKTLMHQCVDAKISMMATDPRLDTWQWLRRFVIETGGLLSVNLRPECSAPISSTTSP